jgi:hypothetical protein
VICGNVHKEVPCTLESGPLFCARAQDVLQSVIALMALVERRRRVNGPDCGWAVKGAIAVHMNTTTAATPVESAKR